MSILGQFVLYGAGDECPAGRVSVHQSTRVCLSVRSRPARLLFLWSDSHLLLPQHNPPPKNGLLAPKVPLEKSAISQPHPPLVGRIRHLTPPQLSVCPPLRVSVTHSLLREVGQDRALCLLPHHPCVRLSIHPFPTQGTGGRLLGPILPPGPPPPPLPDPWAPAAPFSPCFTPNRAPLSPIPQLTWRGRVFPLPPNSPPKSPFLPSPPDFTPFTPRW